MTMPSQQPISLEQLGIPACAIDARGRLVGANSALGEMLGVDAAGLIDADLERLFAPDAVTEARASLDELRLSAPASRRWESALCHADGGALPVVAYLRVDGAGGASLVCTDASEQRNLHDILHNASIGILFSRARRIVSCNPRAAEIFGYAAAELVGQPGIAIYPDEESYARLGRAAAPLLSAGRSFDAEWQMRHRSGQPLWCHLFAKAVDPRHTDQGTIWIVEDISMRRRDEERLRDTLLELEAIMHNAPVAIGFSRDRRIIRYNPRFAEMFGYRGDEGLGRPTIELYPSQEAFEAVGREAIPLLSAGRPFHSEMAMRRQDGETFWAQAIAYLIDPQQPQRGTIWIIDDRSAQKAAAEALGKLMLEQQAILDNASVGIVFSRRRRIERCNPRGAEMLGYLPEELVGQPGVVLYPSAEAYMALGMQAAPLLASGQAFVAELEFLRKNGTRFLGRVRAKAVDPRDTDAGTIWIVEDVTEERRAQEHLRQTLMEMEAIMTNASVAILFTKNRRITRYNRRFAEMFAFVGDQALNLPGATLYPSEEIYRRVGIEAAPLLSAGQPFCTEVEMRRQDGATFWAQLIGYVLDPADTARGTIWIIEDRSEHRRAEQALRNALLENEAILENALIGIAIAERGAILRCNRKMEEILGVGSGELDGRLVRELYPEEAGWLGARAAVATDFAAGRVHASEQELVRHDGRLFWGYLSGRPFDPRQPRGRSVWLLDDVTQRKNAEAAVLRARDELERRVLERTEELAGANAKLQEEMAERLRAEKRIQHMAYHDGLTGLPNRALLADRLKQAMLAAKRAGRRVAVMFIDLDRFKHINDSLGHLVGDGLLKAVARRLGEAIRASDTVARQGGDEFVVVLPDLQESEEATRVARKIVAALANPVRVVNRDLHISPSIGICLYPDDARDVDTLLRNADAAMYHAKASGRNNFQFFTAELNRLAAQRFEMESLLHNALGQNELRLYFQPIVDIATRQPASLEVLLRWQQPKLGLVPPDRFIPILEDNGGIVAVGDWVIRQACRQLALWRDSGLPVRPVAVNLSPRQFQHRGLLETIRDALAQTRLDPRLLELEITETALMQQATQTQELLESLRALGVRLSIDDFGTGYSSLAYLKRFPVDKLKIDRAFVKDCETNPDDRAIISAVLALAGSLGLAVVAEGVETEAQFALLAGKACTYAQGYLFSRPVAAEQVPYLLDPLRERPKLA